MMPDEIRETFRYHSPNPDMVKRHEAIRQTMTEATIKVAAMLPSSRERSLFITDMQRAQMMANAAVAIHTPRENPCECGSATCEWHGPKE